MASRQRTLEQERGKHAWEMLEQVRSQGFRTEYRSLVRKLPSYIMLTGLGQTLAFLQAKGGGGNNEHQALDSHLSQWVLKQLGVTSTTSLLAWILADNRTADDYRRATNETLAYLVWLKRFAEAFIPERSS